MAGPSNIEWCDATWNPIVGCSIVSPGCTNCYAMRMAARIEKMTLRSHYDGTTQPSKAGPVWTGKIARAQEDILLAPLRWRKPRRVFVNSMGDLFHESIPDEWIDRIFAVMALCPQHTFQLLTKRSKRMWNYVGERHSRNEVELAGERIKPSVGRPVSPKWCFDWPLSNVWLGVSCERQEEADERIPHLLNTPAAIRFVSLEPLLGPIDLTEWLRDGHPTHEQVDGPLGMHYLRHGTSRLDWVIVGGESGPHARPMHPDWARSVRDQCSAAGVSFFFKQWGAYGPCEMQRCGAARLSVVMSDGRHFTGGLCLDHPEDSGAEIIARVGKKAAGRLLDGVEHNGFPVIEGVAHKHATTSPDPSHPVVS